MVDGANPHAHRVLGNSCPNVCINRPSERRHQLQVKRVLQEVSVSRLKVLFPTVRGHPNTSFPRISRCKQSRETSLAMRRCQKTSPFIAWHANRIWRLSKSEWRVALVKSARASALERLSRGQKSSRLRRS